MKRIRYDTIPNAIESIACFSMAAKIQTDVNQKELFLLRCRVQQLLKGTDLKTLTHSYRVLILLIYHHKK